MRLCFRDIRPPAFFVILVFFVMAFWSSALAEPIWPDTSGGGAALDGKLLTDFTHVQDGYFTAAVSSQSSHRLKLRVIKDDMTLTYDLNQEGAFEVFPLQLGSGYYEVSLYENVGAKKYSQEGKAAVDVPPGSEDAAFLLPNQYVNYSESSAILSKAEELSKAGDEKKMFEAVCDFMASDFIYDYVRAVTVSPGDLPDIEGSYEKRMGICQDLSAIMIGMLRYAGIHSRLMIGYADDNYHAWTMTSIGGNDEFFDPTAALNAIASPKAYTVERYY